MRHLLTFVIFVIALQSFASQAHAKGYYGPRSEYSPSVFTYGFRGLSIGAMGGTSVGYLVARNDGFESDDWKPIVYGLGIGALSGGVVGLTLGFVDLADDRPGMGNIALRDMFYGGTFGLVAGAIGGTIAAISAEEAEYVLLGSAIGTISGIGVGLIVGLIEGRRIVDSPQHRYPGRAFAPSFALYPDGRGGVSSTLGVRMTL